MTARLSKYAPVVLVLTAALPTACGNRVTPTSPDAVVPQDSSIKAEPQFAQPEIVPDSSCPARPPFGVRLSIILGGRDDVILRGLRFRLTDASGGSVVPEIIRLEMPSPVPPMAPSVPLPSPGAATLPVSPIPIPGSSPMTGIFVSAGTARPLPFFLRFGCGLVPGGTLFIDADAADRFGRPFTSHLRVPIGH